MALNVEPLAELSDLEARLEHDITDDPILTRLCESSLVDASILVRSYGVSTWTVDTAPPIAVMLALKAAARFVNNPMSLETARGADETNMWGESNAKGVYLEPSEIALLREHRNIDGGFQQAPTYVYTDAVAPRGHVPSGHYFPVDSYGDGTAKMFPDYIEGDIYDPNYPSADE